MGSDSFIITKGFPLREMKMSRNSIEVMVTCL